MAAAPSLNGEEFGAVTVPFSAKAGRTARNLSALSYSKKIFFLVLNK